MTQKSNPGKAMPILTIVFASLSLVFFAIKFVVNVCRQMFTGAPNMLKEFMLEDFSKVLTLSVTAVFMIIFAALVLRDNPKTRKIGVIVVGIHMFTCMIVAVRFIASAVSNKGTGVHNIIFTILFIAMAVLCAVCVGRMARYGKGKVLLVIVAVLGLAVACLYFTINAYWIVDSISYYTSHAALFIAQLAKVGSYTLAIAFYYVAFLLMALYIDKTPDKEAEIAYEAAKKQIETL